jgi:hypothetical protein
MKLGVEQKNKIFAIIFIFIISISIATMFHEIGHAISYLFFGCSLPVPMVSPFIIGQTFCNSPEGWYNTINNFQDIIMTFAGPGFVSLIGLILFLIFKKSNYIRKHWVLAFIFYFLIFNFLLNGSLQFISGGDHSYLVGLGINPIYLWSIGIFLLLILSYHTIKFKELMQLSESRIKEKTANKLRNCFLVLFVIICVAYLVFPLIYYLF